MKIYPIDFISLEDPDGYIFVHDVPNQEEERHCGKGKESEGRWNHRGG